MNGSAESGGQPEFTDAAWVVQRAEELLAESDSRTARDIVREALQASGRRADLLWVLADAEFAVGDAVAGRECLAEALAASSGEPTLVARQIRMLRGNGFWREALQLCKPFPRMHVRIPGAGSRWGLLPGVPVSSARGRQLRGRAMDCPRRSGIPAVVLATVRRAVQGAKAEGLHAREDMLQDLRHPSAYIRASRMWRAWMPERRSWYGSSWRHWDTDTTG